MIAYVRESTHSIARKLPIVKVTKSRKMTFENVYGSKWEFQ